VVNLNIDIAVSGSDFGMDAVPELHDILEEVMMAVNAPSGNGTLYDLWRSQGGEFGGESSIVLNSTILTSLDSTWQWEVDCFQTVRCLRRFLSEQ